MQIPFFMLLSSFLLLLIYLLLRKLLGERFPFQFQGLIIKQCFFFYLYHFRL